LVALLLRCRSSRGRLSRRTATAARRSAREPGAWRGLLALPYVGSTLTFAFGMGVLMAYISASPFVYQTLIGLSEIGYGIAFAINAIGMSLTTLASNRLNRRYSLMRLAGTGLTLSMVGVLATLAS